MDETLVICTNEAKAFIVNPIPDTAYDGVKNLDFGPVAWLSRSMPITDLCANSGG